MLPKNTVLDLKIQMYPDKDDSINYYTNLHMFKSKSWLSIGLKPKAKDLKTVIDDLKQMEYLVSNTDGAVNTIVLDGRKVRIGFEGKDIDYLMTKQAEKAQLIKSMCQSLLPEDNQ